MARNMARPEATALSELQHNRQQAGPRITGKVSQERQRIENRGRSESPVKRAPREMAPSKHERAKSGTRLMGFLSGQKSKPEHVNHHETKNVIDKENRRPVESYGVQERQLPIYAQFSSTAAATSQIDPNNDQRQRQPRAAPTKSQPTSRERAKSEVRRPLAEAAVEEPTAPSRAGRSRVLDVFANLGRTRSKSVAARPTNDPEAEDLTDPKVIDKHLEAMLDRRNIPQNQRYKMRNLSDSIKMEFIRQDWAETRATREGHSSEQNQQDASMRTVSQGEAAAAEEDKPKRGRGKSFTFARSRKDSSSPTKRSKGDSSLGRHFRSRSTDSIVSQRVSMDAARSSTTDLSLKAKSQQPPTEFVTYLQRVQKPQLVEVGKLHKLRILLRNETVSWTEEFIQKGGMKEIVGLLDRILEIEWREEHEDALLHENMLCLKALSTTARGMDYLHTIQSELFPRLLGMLFDPEKKGPSEFTTRNLITSILFRYIESAPASQKTSRAQQLLKYLRDPEPKEAERPLPFVLEMRQERPYRVWCKEVVSVTKEVFWIFLHHANVVNLPTNSSQQEDISSVDSPEKGHSNDYMLRHFPQERPPVAAAPYVGSVEWDATNYLASHLDLLNAIMACTPSQDERNALRAALRVSGWERCMGGSLRICKVKFYGSVHAGLETWVAAAAEDGWDVRDVRFGPAPDAKSPKKKGSGGGNSGGSPQKEKEAPPKLEMPTLGLGLGKERGRQDDWLS